MPEMPNEAFVLFSTT